MRTPVRRARSSRGAAALAGLLLGCFALTGVGVGAAAADPADQPSGSETPDADQAAEAAFPGTPTEPGVNAVHPLELDTGLYTAPFPRADRDQYFDYKRKWPGSRIYVGALAPLHLDDAPLDVELFADGRYGYSCIPALGTLISGSGASLTGLSSQLYSDQDTADCRKAESILIRVNTYVFEGSKRPTFDYQLAVWEEPPVSNADELPEPGSLTWTGGQQEVAPTEVQPGLGPGTAPALTTGSWRFRLERGQIPWFRIVLDWGEHVEVRMTTRGADDDDSDSVHASWISPLGGERDTNLQIPGAPFYQLDLRERGEAASGLSTISWRAGEKYPDPDNVDTFVPGPWLLGLVSESVPKQGVDITLHVEVVQDYEPVLPDFAGAPLPVPALDGQLYAVASKGDPSPASPTPQPIGGDAQAGGDVVAADASEVPWPAVTMLLGAATVSTALGLVFFSRARRAGPRRRSGPERR